MLVGLLEAFRLYSVHVDGKGAQTVLILVFAISLCSMVGPRLPKNCVIFWIGTSYLNH